MKALAALVLMSFFGLTAFAQSGNVIRAPKAGDKSALLCNDQKTVCAQLQFLVDLNSSEEASFLAAIETADNSPINNLKIDLWMSMGGGHGHGSAPVEMADDGVRRVKVTNAWFVMPGTWAIRLDFDVQGVHQHLEFPVSITE